LNFHFATAIVRKTKEKDMFSRDKHHYRQAPRTMNEAFGPYSLLEDIQACKRHERYVAIAGVILLGAFLGLLFGWRG